MYEGENGFLQQAEIQSRLLARLKRIEGQVRGIQKMIQEQRSCYEIITQLSAVQAALNKVSLTVLGCHLATHVEDGLKEGKDVKKLAEEFIGIILKMGGSR